MSIISGSVGQALKRFLKGVPIEWVAPIIAEFVVGSLKNPASIEAARPELEALRDALIRKYPLKK